MVRSRPELRTLVIGDEPAAWDAAGFAVNGNETTIGTVRVELAGASSERRGVLGWELAGATMTNGATEVDGIPIWASDGPAAAAPMVEHPNSAVRIDHVVVVTPDLARSLAALEAAGLETRRVRDVPGTEPARRQAFLWVGEPIIELAGPVEPSGDGPARIWGLALSSDDLDRTVATLGPAISEPKPAVQTGRFIATLDTKRLDISVPLAVMSAHVKPQRQ